MQIILIGLRASGKTVIGREIAEQLWSDFRDLDDVTLEAFPKMSVTDVFERHGEAAWREAELEALKRSAPRDEGVLALGGGTAMIDEARALLEGWRDSGAVKIVYLRARAETLRRRLEAETGDRPPLLGDDTADEVDAVLAARGPVYEALAHTCVDVDVLPVGEIATMVIRLVM